MHTIRLLFAALAIINPSILSSMQLPALAIDAECSDVMVNVLTASACENFFNKDWATLARKITLTQAIQESQVFLSSRESLANDITLNQRVIHTLTDAFTLSPEFNTTAGFGDRNSAKKCLIGLRLGTPGAHHWIAARSNNLISSVILNWEKADETHIDTGTVLKYANTMCKTFYAKQFQDDVQLCWDSIFTHFYLNTSKQYLGEIKLLAKLGADMNKCTYIVDPSHPEYTYTPLMISAGTRDEKLTVALVEAGTDVNKQSTRGLTALILAAAQNKNKAILKILLDNGAKMSLSTQVGKTVFDVEEWESYYPEIRDLLLAYAIKKGPGNIVSKLRNRELGKKS